MENNCSGPDYLLIPFVIWVFLVVFFQIATPMYRWLMDIPKVFSFYNPIVRAANIMLGLNPKRLLACGSTQMCAYEDRKGSGSCGLRGFLVPLVGLLIGIPILYSVQFWYPELLIFISICVFMFLLRVVIRLCRKKRR